MGRLGVPRNVTKKRQLGYCRLRQVDLFKGVIAVGAVAKVAVLYCRGGEVLCQLPAKLGELGRERRGLKTHFHRFTRVPDHLHQSLDVSSCVSGDKTIGFEVIKDDGAAGGSESGEGAERFGHLIPGQVIGDAEPTEEGRLVGIKGGIPEGDGEILLGEIDGNPMQRRGLFPTHHGKTAALHWVPVDFAKQDLAAAFRNSPFDPHKPTFFSWLGVTYYLTREQVSETLRTLAGLAPSGSAIVFDYLEADALIAGRAGRDVQRLMEMVRNSGEPMKMGFEPSALPADLAQLGWKLIEDLSPSAIQNRYFSDRTDGYHAFEQIHLAQAAVA